MGLVKCIFMLLNLSLNLCLQNEFILDSLNSGAQLILNLYGDINRMQLHEQKFKDWSSVKLIHATPRGIHSKSLLGRPIKIVVLIGDPGHKIPFLFPDNNLRHCVGLNI